MGHERVDWGEYCVPRAKLDSENGAENEFLKPFGGVMVLFVFEIFQVFEKQPGLAVSIIGQTPERTVRNRLEVSVSSPGRVVLMLLLVVVFGPECFVGVARVGHFVVYRVRVNHPSSFFCI